MTKAINQNIESKVDLIKVEGSRNHDGFAKYLREIQNLFPFS